MYTHGCAGGNIEKQEGDIKKHHWWLLISFLFLPGFVFNSTALYDKIRVRCPNINLPTSDISWTSLSSHSQNWKWTRKRRKNLIIKSEQLKWALMLFSPLFFIQKAPIQLFFFLVCVHGHDKNWQQQSFLIFTAWCN